jgi:hypothetical protein
MLLMLEHNALMSLFCLCTYRTILCLIEAHAGQHELNRLVPDDV